MSANSKRFQRPISRRKGPIRGPNRSSQSIGTGSTRTPANEKAGPTAATAIPQTAERALESGVRTAYEVCNDYLRRGYAEANNNQHDYNGKPDMNNQYYNPYQSPYGNQQGGPPPMGMPGPFAALQALSPWLNAMSPAAMAPFWNSWMQLMQSAAASMATFTQPGPYGQGYPPSYATQMHQPPQGFYQTPNQPPGQMPNQSPGAPAQGATTSPNNDPFHQYNNPLDAQHHQPTATEPVTNLSVRLSSPKPAQITTKLWASVTGHQLSVDALSCSESTATPIFVAVSSDHTLATVIDVSVGPEQVEGTYNGSIRNTHGDIVGGLTIILGATA